MSKTVLIVEDEIFVALDLERILADAGYHVAGIAADSSDALTIGPACAIAFVDVNLRDGPTGPEVAAKLAREHDVKVVFVTANPAQVGPDHGAIGYIQKPFTEASIVAAAALASGADHPAATNEDLVLYARSLTRG